MKKKVIISATIIFGVLVILFLLNRDSDSERKTIYKLKDAVKTGTTKICFNDINLDFDSLMIIWPYANTPLLKSEIGIDITRTGIRHRGDINLILYLKERKIIEKVYIDATKFRSMVSIFKIFPKNYEFKLKHAYGITEIREQ